MCVTPRICRLCLSNQRRTFSVTNTVLQNVWERLTTYKFDKDDGRPLVICYICCAHLRKSHELMERALKAEKLFTKYITNNHYEASMELVSLIDSKAYDIDYKYAIEQQYNVEFKHRGTDISEEVKEDYINVKKEMQDDWGTNISEEVKEDCINVKEDVQDDWTVFKDETITAEDEMEIEHEEILLKEENVFLDSNHAENDTNDIVTGTCSEGDDRSGNLSVKTVFQKEIRIVLERIDADSSARKCKTTKKTVLKSPSKWNSTIIYMSCSKNLSTSVNMEIPNGKHVTVPGVDCFQVNNISQKKCAKNVILQNEKTLSSKIISCMDAGNESLPNTTSAIAAPITLLDGSGEKNKPNICNKKRSDKHFPCLICHYKFARNQDLKRHMQIHTGEKPQICGLCDYKSSDKKDLKRHMQYKHTKEKNFSCHICQYKCVEKHTLELHLRSHTGEQPYICELCDYKSSKKSHLKRHLQYKHTKEKNFSCHICQYKCVVKYDLEVHLRNHTGEKPYICGLCDYKSCKKSHLKRHLQYKHTKEKNFSCHMCQYKCVVKYDLEVHLQNHSGKKPYICELCDYKSSNNSHLKRHLQYKHTKQNNYSCHICQYKFVEKGTLNRHLRKHTSERPYVHI